MFAARGIAVSFSVFVLLYGVLSLAVCCAWRRVWPWIKRYPVGRTADLLFALRLLPFLAAVAVTAFFTVPSFLVLEPRTTDEPVGAVSLALGLSGLLLAALGAGNVTACARRASRTIDLWKREAKLVDRCGAVPVLRILRVVPALTASGILRPRVLLSRTAEFLLTTNELQTALRHEFAHIRRWDNLKKLLFHFVPFPGMSGLEAAWLEATEMAADDGAVSNATEALDLAAAIIKLSRLGWNSECDSGELEMGLAHSAAASTNERVERLIRWSEGRHSPQHGYPSWCVLAGGLATIAVLGITYSQLLVQIHSVTEWLVR